MISKAASGLPRREELTVARDATRLPLRDAANQLRRPTRLQAAATCCGSGQHNRVCEYAPELDQFSASLTFPNFVFASSPIAVMVLMETTCRPPESSLLGQLSSIEVGDAA